MTSEISLEEFTAHLQNELKRRRQLNEQYSLRAFARHLDLDPSTVSQMIAGKRNASMQMITRVCEKIGWPQGAAAPKKSSAYTLISQDAVIAIADWYHYAILDLTLLKSFISKPEWIARKLNISIVETRSAIERLKRLGMLLEKNGRLSKGQPHYVNYVEGQSSAAHKEYQRQIIQKALEAIDSCPGERKDITAMTIAVNSSRLEEAKKRIRKFRRELCDYLEVGDGDSVYMLNVQLFPLTDLDN